MNNMWLSWPTIWDWMIILFEALQSVSLTETVSRVLERRLIKRFLATVATINGFKYSVIFIFCVGFKSLYMFIRHLMGKGMLSFKVG